MSWVTILWSMIASACLTLAAIYFLVWCQRRTVWACLLFSITSVAVATYTLFELSMMQADTPAQFATALRWLHVPVWVLILSFVGFVRLHLRAGWPWLAWTICALRTLALLLNFLVGQNLNFREVTSLRHIRLLGEFVSSGVGVSNPCVLVGQLSLLLMLAFVLDATITVWRRGERRLALATGGSFLFFALLAVVDSVLVFEQIVNWPLTASFSFFGIVVAMGYEMSRETLRAAKLSDDLRESEERIALAAEAAQFGVWELNLASNQIRGSAKWLGLFGFVAGEDISLEKVIQRIHSDDRERVRQAINRALKERAYFKEEYRVMLPDGTQHWIASQGRMHTTAAGRPDRALGAATEITERKRGEEKMRQLSHALEQSPGLIIITDTSGNIVYVNRKFTEVTGYSLAECIGQNPRILKSGESSPEMYQKLWADITNGKMWRGEFHNRKKNGELYWEGAVISPLLDASGKITHFVGVKEDITERRQAEMVLRDLSGRLINAHEEERARLARELHDDLTQRLAILAIEAGRVERDISTSPAAETLCGIRRGLVRLSEDIHALSYRLHPSVLEDLGLGDALKTECEQFSRRESIETAVQMKDLPASLPQGAALCLFRVAQEALRNVARHARASSVEVSLSRNDGGLQLSIRDSGVGFDSTGHRHQPSLGLASMKERVRLIGGQLTIESAPGNGTNIVVWVPLNEKSL